MIQAAYSFALASRPEVVHEAFNLADSVEYSSVIAPVSGDYIPVIHMLPTGLNLVLAKWGIRDQNGKEHCWISARKLMATKPMNVLAHANRCVVPSNCFLASELGSHTLVRLLNHRLHGMGAVMQRTGNEVRVCLIATDSADILRAKTSLMPAMMVPDKILSWLAKKDMYRIMEMVDRSGNHWFDFFEIQDVMSMKTAKSEDLKPIGRSYVERQHELEKLKKLEIDQMRINRTSSKG